MPEEAFNPTPPDKLRDSPLTMRKKNSLTPTPPKTKPVNQTPRVNRYKRENGGPRRLRKRLRNLSKKRISKKRLSKRLSKKRLSRKTRRRQKKSKRR